MPTDDLWPGLKDMFHTIYYADIARLWGHGQTNTSRATGAVGYGKIMFSLRKDMDNRLIMGTMGRTFGTAQQGIDPALGADVKGHVSDLGAVSIAEVWHGKIAMTPDHLPALYQLASGLDANWL